MSFFRELLSRKEQEPFNPDECPGHLAFPTEVSFAKYAEKNNLHQEVEVSWVGCNIASSTHEKGYNYQSDLWLATQKSHDSQKGYLFAVDPLIIQGIRSRAKGFMVGSPNWPEEYPTIEPILLPLLADNEILQNLIGNQADEVLIVAPNPETYEALIVPAYSFIKPDEGKLTMILDSQSISYIQENWQDPLTCIEYWYQLCENQGSQPNFQANGIDLDELHKPSDIPYMNLEKYFKKGYPESLPHIPKNYRHFSDPRVLVLEISKN
jgi:hypothetical protein